MELEVRDDFDHAYKEYRLRIPRESLLSVKLTDFDRTQLESVPDGKTPVADKLLDLQTIVLRIEEQAAQTPLTDNKKR